MPGIGIPQEKQAIIFEPFTQADNSISRVYGGTGLGTTIAWQLVTLMGGTMGLTSTVGVGSTFWFEVPLPVSEPIGVDLTEEVATTSRLSSAAASIVAQQPAKITKIRGARVLVAEDNATNRRLTQLILESGGHRATIVDNGESALECGEITVLAAVVTTTTSTPTTNPTPSTTAPSGPAVAGAQRASRAAHCPVPVRRPSSSRPSRCSRCSRGPCCSPSTNHAERTEPGTVPAHG